MENPPILFDFLLQRGILLLLQKQFFLLLLLLLYQGFLLFPFVLKLLLKSPLLAKPLLFFLWGDYVCASNNQSLFHLFNHLLKLFLWQIICSINVLLCLLLCLYRGRRALIISNDSSLWRFLRLLLESWWTLVFIIFIFLCNTGRLRLLRSLPIGLSVYLRWFLSRQGPLLFGFLILSIQRRVIYDLDLLSLLG